MFDWNQYLLLAEKLFYLRENEEFNGLKEACLRSALSRAYYAVFCIARNYLIDKNGVRIPKEDTHKFVHMRYVNSLTKEEKKVGENLKQLWKKRKKADYDDPSIIWDDDVDFSLRIARDTLSLIRCINK